MSVFYDILKIVCIVCSIGICLPLIPHRTVRFYGCYISYVVSAMLLAALYLPVAMARPKNIVNLKLYAATARHFTKILGIKWELRNRHILEADRGAVIVANHQSILDVMGMFNIWHIMGKCSVIAKKQMLYIPIFGQMAWLSGLVLIDRLKPKEANERLRSAAQVFYTIRGKMWLFPEGTRNKDINKGVLPFKRGAFRIAIECKVPIIPVVYSPYYFIDSRKKTFDYGKVVISVLKSIPTEDLTTEDIDQLIEKTHKVMSEEYKRLKEEVIPGQNR